MNYEQDQLANKAMAGKRALEARGELKNLEGMTFKKTTWRDTNRAKLPSGKMSCLANEGLNDVIDYIVKPDGTTTECYVLAGDNLDLQYYPLQANKLNLMMMTNKDGLQPSLQDADGNNHTLHTGLKQFAQYTSALSDSDLSVQDMPEEIIQYVLQGAFITFKDPKNEDEQVMKHTKVRSLMSGSGADCAYIHFGGFGMSGGLLEGGYGSMTKISPTRFVKGDEYTFDLMVTPMVDANGDNFTISQSGTEDNESATKAAAKGYSVELPVGPAGCKKITSHFTAIVPIEKMAPPPPELIKDVLYVAEDPLNLAKVYCYKRTDNRYVWAPTQTVLVRADKAVTLHRYAYPVQDIIGYQAATQPIAHPEVYVVVDPVASLSVYAHRWTDGTFRRIDGYVAVGGELTAGPGLYYRNIRGYQPAIDHSGVQYRSLSASAAACLPPVDDEEEEEEEEEDRPRYRGQNLSAATAAPTVVPTAMEEEEPVMVDVADAAPDAPAAPVANPVPDTSSDEAIAKAVSEEEAAAPSADAPAPPMVGDKRSLSTAGRSEEPPEPEVNCTLTRQSCGKNSTGKLRKIARSVKRRNTGAIIVTETITIGIKEGEAPTDEDWRQLDALFGKRIAAIKKASGKEAKKLSDSFSEKVGVTSTAPLSTTAKIDIAATVQAVGVVSAPIGIPVGLFSPIGIPVDLF